jgi:hypothetical protein
MPKKYFFLALTGLLVLSVVLAGAFQDQKRVAPTPEGLQVQQPTFRAPCGMTRSSTTPAGYWGQYQAGIGTYSYFDPALFCADPVYPYEITAFSFVLYDPAASVYTWPAEVDIVVYGAGGGGACGGPGAELCRYSLTADSATYAYPNVGTFLFPTPCCARGPFFIGLEYRSGVAGKTPSVMFDNALTPDTCMNWIKYTDGLYYEWKVFWTAPVPGDPMYWVDGETNSAACPSACKWEPGDPYKSHFPQLPDEAGWDVNATQPMVLADDFQCTETGWIKDIHFWGSWKGGIESPISAFVLSLHADIPAEQSPTGYSMPGATLWERSITDFQAVPFDPAAMEGWYDPATGEIIFNDHQHYYRYDVCLNEPDWLWQDSGRVYWLNISAIVADQQAKWGWKSTRDHWNDDAVWATWGNLNWVDMWEPTQPLVNPFNATVDPTGMLIGGGGGGAYGQGWYFYPMEDWWNIWFYDHPFAPERRKAGFIEFDVFPFAPGPLFLDVAVNWSTDFWSIEQPPLDSAPPLPPVDEHRYVGRDSLITIMQPGHYRLPYLISMYNPEWVSVDIRGSNFIIENGTIVHECQASLDLAFVITGEAEPPEACCLPDGSCLDLPPSQCLAQQGVPQGPGSKCTVAEACCLSDGSCAMLDPLCCDQQGGTPQGTGSQCTQTQACCFPDGSCQMLDPLCCDEAGGTVSLYSNVCLGDANQNGVNDACEPPSGACCYPDGSCLVTTQAGCLMTVGAVYKGDGTKCLGDNNQNGVDDACDDPWQPGDPFKMHFPQLPNLEGWDVYDNATLADDWQCRVGTGEGHPFLGILDAWIGRKGNRILVCHL